MCDITLNTRDKGYHTAKTASLALQKMASTRFHIDTSLGVCTLPVGRGATLGNSSQV